MGIETIMDDLYESFLQSLDMQECHMDPIKRKEYKNAFFWWGRSDV